MCRGLWVRTSDKRKENITDRTEAKLFLLYGNRTEAHTSNRLYSWETLGESGVERRSRQRKTLGGLAKVLTAGYLKDSASGS